MGFTGVIAGNWPPAEEIFKHKKRSGNLRSFHMVRHGETTTNFDKIATGWMDVSLTEKGRQQAAECRNVIHSNGLKPDFILCSGLRRTKETADIINRNLNCPVIQHLELNEQSFGDWEGKRWDVVYPEIEKYGKNPPNGEMQQDFIERILNAFETLLERYNGDILFVTHGGVFKALYHRYGIPQGKIANGLLYQFEFSERDGSLANISQLGDTIP